VPVWQAVSKQSLSKCPTSPPTVQREVAKKPSTITSHDCGGGSIATRSWQAPEPHDNPEAPRDVLLDHHHCNGVLRTPDPGHLAPLTNKSQTDGDMGPSVTVQAAGGIQDSVMAKAHTGANNDPTILKFYDAVWKAVLNCAKSLAHLDAVIDDTFPEQHVYISKRAIKFISQAIAEFEEDNVQPDKSFLKKTSASHG
jgi:hypothetical protein